MNEELTRDVLEAMKKCSENSCSECPAVDVCCSEDDWEYTIQTLATALLAEKAKPKVWDGAPDEADYVTVGAYKNSNPLAPIKVKCYTREIPKTRTRIMAEEIASAKISNEADLVDIIEQTIKNHFAELKEES
jgi:hypothetical protein